MQDSEFKKFALIVFSMLRSVGVFTMAAFGAVVVALISGLPSLVAGSWQADMYPDMFARLANCFFPAMIAMTMLGLGSSAADEVLAKNMARKPWVFWVYTLLIAGPLLYSLYQLVEGFGELSGFVTAGVENALTAANAVKR